MVRDSKSIRIGTKYKVSSISCSDLLYPLKLPPFHPFTNTNISINISTNTYTLPSTSNSHCFTYSDSENVMIVFKEPETQLVISGIFKCSR